MIFSILLKIYQIFFFWYLTFFFKISHHFSCLQPVLTQKLTSVSCNALSDYTTSGSIRKEKQNSWIYYEKPLLFINIIIHTSPFFNIDFLVNMQLGKFVPERYKQKMTSKTKHKSLEDESEEFGGRGDSLGKVQYKRTRWKAKWKDVITWGEAV